MTLSMTSASAAASLSTIRCIRQDENVGQYIALLRFGMFLKQQLGDRGVVRGVDETLKGCMMCSNTG